MGSQWSQRILGLGFRDKGKYKSQLRSLADQRRMAPHLPLVIKNEGMDPHSSSHITPNTIVVNFPCHSFIPC